MIVTGPAAIDKSGARPPDLAPAPNAVSVLGTDTPVILDSNVWIDLLVFTDPTVEPIRRALDAGSLHVVIDEPCLRELSYVLLYPQFARFAVNDAQALAQTHAWTHAVASIQAHEDARRAAAIAEVLETMPLSQSASDDLASASSASASTATTSPTSTRSSIQGQPVLPRCSDRDDQKFLTLAAATGARWLVTKDKALLKLHRRMLRDFGCHVVLPTTFTALALGAA